MEQAGASAPVRQVLQNFRLRHTGINLAINYMLMR